MASHARPGSKASDLVEHADDPPILRIMMRALLSDRLTMSTRRARGLALIMLDDLKQCGALVDPKLLDLASQRVDATRYTHLQQARYLQTGERD